MMTGASNLQQDYQRGLLDRFSEILSEQTRIAIAHAEMAHRQAELLTDVLRAQGANCPGPQPAGGGQLRLVRKAG